MFDFIEDLQQCGSIEQIHSTCSRFCLNLGFDYFHYGARIPVSFSKPHYVFISGYPDAWWRHYDQQEYLFKDPTVMYCANNITPLFWKSFERKTAAVAGDINVIREAREFGLRNGLSIPVHSATGESAIFSVASELDAKRSQSLIDTESPRVHMFASYVHETVRRVIIESSVAQVPGQLSAREKECLLWAADGKTTWETSQILNVSERTVIFHLRNATEKLQVSNKSHAVARAVLNGLISPFSR